MSSKAEPMKNLTEEPLSLLTSLPEDIRMQCIARVPRSYHPIFSFVSKQSRSLVTSPELFKIRSRLGYDKHSLYVAISNDQTTNIHWYTLGRKPNNKPWLVHIPSLPPMPLHGSCVVVGSDIYVMGGFEQWGVITKSVSRIDCVSHTVQPLAKLPNAVAGSVAEHIEGKIYVIGGSDTRSREKKSFSEIIMIFDTEAQTWKTLIYKAKARFSQRPVWEVGQKYLSSVEMAGKIYMRSYDQSYVFDPKEGKVKTDPILHSQEWSNSCILDSMLYYYDIRKGCLRAYDLKENIWGVVNGVELGLFEDGSWSFTQRYGGNLAVLLQKVVASTETREIWCAEIAVERREDGELWGKVEWYELVLDGGSSMMKCLSVKV